MLMEDMRRLAAGTTLEADLAIVGTGPAGLSIARAFFGTDVRVVLLESGGVGEAPEVAPSETFENAGAPRFMNPRRVRNRCVGGSSQTWSGRCRTFDAIDFEPRSWVPHSGWPISKEDLAPYEERAAEAMHLGPNIYDGRLWPLLGHGEPGIAPAPDLLEPCFWQFSRDPGQPAEFLRFGPQFLGLRADNVRVLTNATVTHIDTDESGRITSLELASAPGHVCRLRPKIAVLAAGGIENTRLLLLSNRQRPAGLGNGNDLVGRYLMDHPRTTVGEFTGPAVEAIQTRLGLYQFRQAGKASFYAPGVRLSPELQRKEQMLNCAAYLSEDRSADDPWDAINRLRSGQSENRAKDMMRAMSSPGRLLEGLYQRQVNGRNVSHKLDRLVVDCLVEQVPDPDSRLTLSEKTDELGQPLPRIFWKVSELEKRSVATLARTFAREFARLGLKPPALQEWIARDRPQDAVFTDAAHPTGTTRMSHDPKTGVVDADCRLHEARGLYITGSSVFPTASHANPTLMIVAMALRLADLIKQRHFGLTC
ncbi:GMC family oxidoreductase [Azorhizobium oxalatiphilum]|uniref:GMC family oxidoreductase n=1 Tax=Azorhizobium oxalatiphilum TaxID=980631 RepID=A0A917F7Y5_9HYPH|nr:GMC family oxidoreductase [Azorhizobium oxalatiphilum]GGF54387.1 GMC family oxidoreductase [Azorhizobium oxalatiphilum]